MGQRSTGGLSDILGRISSQDYETKKSKINVAAFIPVCDFVENGQIISNLAYVLANNELNVCVVDFKVFYPNLYTWLNVSPNKKGEGLLRLLRNYRNDINTIVTPTLEKNLFLLSPSPHDNIEDYYNFDFKHIETAIAILRDKFDVILIDVPNNPPLEFCLGSMMNCMQGFFTASERVDILANMVKLLSHVGTIGISGAKFLEVIFVNTYDTPFDYSALKKHNFSITAQLPFVKEAFECPLEGKLYMRDAELANKIYVSEMLKLAGKFL